MTDNEIQDLINEFSVNKQISDLQKPRFFSLLSDTLFDQTYLQISASPWEKIIRHSNYLILERLWKQLERAMLND